MCKACGEYQDSGTKRLSRTGESVLVVDSKEYYDDLGPEDHARMASCYGNVNELIRAVTERGADPNTCENQPIQCAVRHGNIRCVEYLLTLDVNPRVYGDQALRHAMAIGDVNMV